jgi:hypothetical protein
MWRISVLAEQILVSQVRVAVEFNELHANKITLPRTVCIEIKYVNFYLIWEKF